MVDAVLSSRLIIIYCTSLFAKTQHSLTHSLVDLPRWGLATADDHSDIFLLHCARSRDISFSWMYSQPVHCSMSCIHCLLIAITNKSKKKQKNAYDKWTASYLEMVVNHNLLTVTNRRTVHQWHTSSQKLSERYQYVDKVLFIPVLAWRSNNMQIPLSLIMIFLKNLAVRISIS